MKTKHLALVLSLCVMMPSASLAGGTVHVRGYTRKDGTYVAPYSRSAPRNAHHGYTLSGPPPAAITAAETPAVPDTARLDKPPRTRMRAAPRTSVRTVRTTTARSAEAEVNFREWKNADGETIATGRFLSLLSETLWVKTREGVSVKIPLGKLSEADVKYLDSRAWEKGTAAAG